MGDLIKKKCIPCEGIGRAYTVKEVESHLGEVPGWVLGGDDKSIERCFTMKNFVACVNLINKIKDLAEDEMHHPDLHLTGYKNLKAVLYTHALGGVTENDLILAAKINQLSQPGDMTLVVSPSRLPNELGVKVKAPQGQPAGDL